MAPQIGYNTLRKCIECGDPIRSKWYTSRKPVNKVNLCKKHLLAKRVGKANPNFKGSASA